MRLPILSGAELVKALGRAGWKVNRQRGSHIILEKEGVDFVLTVPAHPELKRGTLHGILKDANITLEELETLLK